MDNSTYLTIRKRKITTNEMKRMSIFIKEKKYKSYNTYSFNATPHLMLLLVYTSQRCLLQNLM